MRKTRTLAPWLVTLMFTWVACDDTEPVAPSGEERHANDEHAGHVANDEHAGHGANDHAGHVASDEHAEHAEHAEHVHHEPLPALDAADPRASLHDLPNVFHDPEGNGLAFRDFRGHPTLVAMFYGSCTTVCPLILSDLARIDENVASERLRIAVATFDPERDTPERLRAVRDERGFDASRWKLLRGDEESTRDLAMAIGVQYRKLADGEYAHSALIVLLDGEGRVVTRHEGLGRPLDDVVRQARALMGGAP
ncbi:MAG: SCO family protein [Polyangiales bacterium]